MEAEVQALEQALRLMLLPSDPTDSKNVIVEIRAGTGGDEAGLFAADLYRMYSRWAEAQRYKVDVLSHNGIGGFRKLSSRCGDRALSPGSSTRAVSVNSARPQH